MKQGSVQLDMGQVVQRTADVGGQVVASLTAQLGMANEVIAQQQTRLAELERALAEKDPPAEPPVPGTTD